MDAIAQVIGYGVLLVFAMTAVGIAFERFGDWMDRGRK